MTTEADGDQALLRRIRAGEDHALGELFDAHRERLRRMLQLRLDRRLQGRIDPSDVIQEAFVDAARRLAEYTADPAMPLFLWLRFLTAQRLVTLHRSHLGVKARDARREVSLHSGPLPATVESVKIEKEKLGKHKTTEVVVVQFSKALNMGAAQNIKNYSLGTIPKSKKQTSKPVLLASASYNPSTSTVTLSTRKALVLNPPLDLTITAAGLLDALGRPMSATYLAKLSKGGATVSSAAPLVHAKGLSAEVVDAVFSAGFRRDTRHSNGVISQGRRQQPY
jgi:RNA polymerase sigma-70 factor, ECF subfamily